MGIAGRTSLLVLYSDILVGVVASTALPYRNLHRPCVGLFLGNVILLSFSRNVRSADYFVTLQRSQFLFKPHRPRLVLQ